eukprot:GHVT01028114.1.p2 GENE.GHVT01028114.1~~GHVT01028114.1.p2  ORF type:complete len:215 (+),score=12.11 GHVT01028114.1:3105-3749(+)
MASPRRPDTVESLDDASEVERDGSTVIISSCACAKIMMHAFKHPQNTVGGVLLGEVESISEAAGEDTTIGSTIRCEDVFPLFHRHSLTPMIPLGFSLAEQLCSMVESPGGIKKRIVGYYQCDSPCPTDDEESKLQNSAIVAADKVRENYPGAILCLLDARRLSMETNPILVFSKSRDGWSQLKPDNVIVSAKSLSVARRAISEARCVGDFSLAT